MVSISFGWWSPLATRTWSMRSRSSLHKLGVLRVHHLRTNRWEMDKINPKDLPGLENPWWFFGFFHFLGVKLQVMTRQTPILSLRCNTFEICCQPGVGIALGCPRKLGSMVRISGLFHLLINRVFLGVITHWSQSLILTFCPGHPSI